MLLMFLSAAEDQGQREKKQEMLNEYYYGKE